MNELLTPAHLAIFGLSLAGFGGLALASDREGETLLGRQPSPRLRLAARATGWCLLGVALAIGVLTWRSGVGLVIWLGWLTIAGAALAFTLPRRRARTMPSRPARPAPPKGARAARAGGADQRAGEPLPASVTGRLTRRALGRAGALALAVATAVVFGTALLRVQASPLHGETAIQDTVGPWTFTLAEADPGSPEIVDMGVPLKGYRLRFCADCDGAIRQAYLKVNAPRSLRAAGMAFEGNRWERRVEIQMPATLSADSELWLTVVGKDGSVHQQHWPMSRVSPATVGWFNDRRTSDEHL